MKFERKWTWVAALVATGCSASGVSDAARGAGGKADFIGDACGGDYDRAGRCVGQTEFETAYDVPAWRGGLEAAAAASQRGADGAAKREVEGSDIYRVIERDGRKLLFTLSAYRGLNVFDITTPESDVPRIDVTGAGDAVVHLDLDGSPEEMFVDGDFAMVLLNGTSEDGRWRSKLRVLDISNAEDVKVAADDVELGDRVVGAKLVRATDGSSGSVIYVATQHYEHGAAGTAWSMKVRSLDVTLPTEPTVVSELELPMTSGSVLHVATEGDRAYMFVGYTEQTNQGGFSDATTTIRKLDISSPTGRIETGRGDAWTIRLPGGFNWNAEGAEQQISYRDGQLRTATFGWVREGDRFENRVYVASTWVADEDPGEPAVIELEDLDGNKNQTLRAVKFEGEYGYMFHMEQVDPLTIVDFSSPGEPTVVSQTGIAGWVNQIVPRDVDGDGQPDLLFGLGVDQAARRGQELMLVAFDVRDLSAVRELDRSVVENRGGWSWTTATYDARAMGLFEDRAYDDVGYVALPMSSSFSDADGLWKYESFLQFFRFNETSCLAGGEGCLVARGGAVDVGDVKRTIGGDDAVVAFGDELLTVIDHDHPSGPKLVSSHEIARDVVDFEVASGVGVQLVRRGGSAFLRSVPLDAPDVIGLELAEVEVGPSPGETHRLSVEVGGADDGDYVVHVGPSADWQTSEMRVVRVGEDGALDVVSTTTLGRLGYSGFRGMMPWAPAGQDSYLAGNKLALFTFAEDGEEAGSYLRVYDLAAPGSPRRVYSQGLGEENVVAMKVEGEGLFVSTYQAIPAAADEGAPAPVVPLEPAVQPELAARLLPGPMPTRLGKAAYHLHIYLLADGDDVVEHGDLSVPGVYVGSREALDGLFLFTTDRLFHEGGRTAFDALRLEYPEEGKPVAVLSDVFGDEIVSNVTDVFVSPEGDTAYFAQNTDPFFGGPVFLEGAAEAAPTSDAPTLVALDLTRSGEVDGLRVKGELALETDGYHRLVAIGEAAGRLYAGVQLGWGRLGIVDVSDGTSMQLRRVFEVSSWYGERFLVDDDKLFLPSGLAGLRVVCAGASQTGCSE